jgi:hypothetical protein
VESRFVDSGFGSARRGFLTESFHRGGYAKDLRASARSIFHASLTARSVFARKGIARTDTRAKVR